MAKPGPAARPSLQVVREGNPSKRPIRDGVKTAPVDELPAPDWLLLFPKKRRPSRPRKPPRGAEEHHLRAWRSKVYLWELAVKAIDGATRARDVAAAEWQRVVPVLAKTAGLAEIDLAVVTDYCVAVGRLADCEHRLSVEGLIVVGQRGECRNPLTTVAAQYRTQLKTYIGELGLSPSARSGITPPGDDDDDGDDPFD